MSDFQPVCSHQHRITGSVKSALPVENGGGILADDMGLGKSLTMLSTIVGSLDHAQKYANSKPLSQSSTWDDICYIKSASKSTLVVVPSDCRFYLKSSSHMLFYRLIMERRSVLLEGWVEEVRKSALPFDFIHLWRLISIDRHIRPDAVKFHKYHGSNRESEVPKLLEFDIIFTTYATLTAGFCRGDSILHQIRWFRLVLDEGELISKTFEISSLMINSAHVIRHQSTKKFRAVFELESNFRWCLTGTPIQNKLDDLASLVKFLRIPVLDTMPTFRKQIIRPIELEQDDYLRNLRLLLDSMCLRRTNELLNLPVPTERLSWVQLSPKEDHLYTRIGDQARIEIENAICGRKTTKAYSTVLQILLQLRLLCNVGTYQRGLSKKSATKDSSDPVKVFQSLQKADQANCVFCSNGVRSLGISECPDSAYLTNCQHLICASCLQIQENDIQWNKHQKKPECSSCLEQITQYFMARSQGVEAGESFFDAIQPSSIEFEAENGYSSKMSALLSNLAQDMTNHKRFG